MRLRTATTSLAAAALMVVGSATASHAASKTITDAGGDVQVLNTSPSSDTATKKSVDIKKMTVTHSKFITWKFKVADLNRGDGVAAYGLVKAGGTKYAAYVDFTVLDQDPGLVDQDFNFLPCTGLTGSKNAKKDLIVVKLPRACVGNPASIAFGGAVAGMNQKSQTLADDARRDGGAINDVFSFAIGGKLKFN